MRSRTLAFTVVALAMTALLSPMQEKVSAQAGAAIVISEFRFRGPQGANDEFIELFNAGSAPVNIGGWLIRTSNNNTPPAFATRVTIAANTIINPGCYFLAVNNNASGGYSGSVPGNQTYATGFADDGGVALQRTLPTAIVDQVGQGTAAAAYGEGTRLPMLTTDVNRGVERRPGGPQGHVDTNNNFNDFQEIFPGNPQNSSSACLTQGSIAITTTVSSTSVEQGGVLTVFGQVSPGTVPPSTGVQVVGNLSAIGGSATTALFDNGVSPDLVANDLIYTTSVAMPANNPLGPRTVTLTVSDAQSRSASNSASVNVTAPAVIYVPHDIQGAGAVSPFASGTSVTVRGVVTARKSDGFFLQTEPGMEDADANTSEGLFVLVNGGAPAAAQVGRVVNVTAAVAELVPSADPGSPSLTGLGAVVAVTDVSAGTVPAAHLLTSSEVSAAGTLDQLERFEGMRVSVASLTAVSGTGGNKNEANATSTSDGAFYAVLTGQARPFREPGVASGYPVLPCAIGPCNVPVFDGNPERLRVDSDALEGLAAVNVSTGAVMTDVTGPLDFGSRTYTLLPETPLSPVGGMAVLSAPAPGGNQFTVASLNLERFYDTTNDPGADVALTAAAYQTRLAKASLTVRNVLNMPDIIGLQEVENLGALFALASRIDTDAVAAGQQAPQYTPFLFEGNDQSGIDVAFLVKQAGGRVLMLSVDQVGKDETYVDPSDSSVVLMNDRPPVVLRATVFGPATSLPQNVTVIVNHLRSLTGVELNGLTGQRAREQRRAQAEFLANYIQGRQINDPNEAIVSLGGYNAFHFNDGYGDSVGTVRGVPASPDQVATASPDVVSPDLVDAGDLSDPSDRYSVVSGGNAQALDHVLMSANLASQFAGLVHPRVNADFPEVLRGDATTASRLSDHDPLVAYFNLPLDVDAPVFSPNPQDQVAEATGPDGAAVSYNLPTASDNLDSSVAVTCAPISGSTFALGNSGVTCSAQDLAGNLATASFTVTVQDTTAPLLTVPANVTEEATSAAGRVVSFATSATDSVTPSLTVLCSPASGSTFPLGTTTVSCSTQDNAGNSAAASFTVTVQDTTAPLLTVPANMTGEATSAAGRVVSFATSATDSVTPSLSVLCSPASGSTFPLGTTTVSCSTLDNAGNSAAASFTVTVQDTTAPLLMVPANITEEATSAAGRVVSFATSATDSVTPSLTVLCSPASGSTFPLGTTTVSCSTQDNAGNSAAASFTVTVQDTTAPLLTVPANMTGEATSAAGRVVSFATSATDSVTPSLSVLCSPASGSTFPLGTTTVSCSTLDNAGNSAAASFTVTVQDTTAPLLMVPANMTEEATSAAGRVVAFATNATDSVTPSLTVLCAPASGSTFPLGTTTVSCSTQDDAGNSTAASFTVTVRDTQAPTLVLPSNLTDEATSPSGKSVWFVATANDAVSPSPAVTCTPASGSTFPVGSTLVSCVATDAAGNSVTGSFTVTITLTPTTPVFGHMTGIGDVVSAGQRTWFAFDVREAANHTERGWVMLQVRGGPGRPDRYQAFNVTDVQFSNSDGYSPGRWPRSGVDTVVFSGVGRWNGHAGYRFEITASDRGEPGRDHDTFSLKVYSPTGALVESVDGTLHDGNIQSLR